jgi:hypothetical protein
MRVSRSSLAALAFACSVGAGAVACGDAAEPQATLVGSWELIAFTDDGVRGAGSGTVTFNADGTWTTAATVTYPGEPPDSIVAGGTWTASATQAVLTTGDASGTWALAWSNAYNNVTLTLQPPDLPNVMELGRLLPLD